MSALSVSTIAVGPWRQRSHCRFHFHSDSYSRCHCRCRWRRFRWRYHGAARTCFGFRRQLVVQCDANRHICHQLAVPAKRGRVLHYDRRPLPSHGYCLRCRWPSPGCCRRSASCMGDGGAHRATHTRGAVSVHEGGTAAVTVQVADAVRCDGIVQRRAHLGRGRHVRAQPLKEILHTQHVDRARQNSQGDRIDRTRHWPQLCAQHAPSTAPLTPLAQT